MGTGMEREREREREGNGNENRNRNGNENGRQRQTPSDGRIGQERTMSDGRVGQGDGQRRTDVSDREADSVGRMCRTGTGGARRVSPILRYGGNGGNGGNRDEVDIPNRIQEVA